MRYIAITLVLLAISASPAAAQQRTAVQKAPNFAEGVEQAKTAVAGEQFGTAIAALQAAIRDIQKMQRTAVLAALPKPDGWQFEDQPLDNPALAAGMANMIGMTINRQYHKGDDLTIAVEVMANSPMVQMMGMMFANPAMIAGDGGELVKYGQHKAILKKEGDSGLELQILMYDAHLIKATAHGVSADDLLKIFDQAFVDRLEKPLGK